MYITFKLSYLMAYILLMKKKLEEAMRKSLARIVIAGIILMVTIFNVTAADH